jgi:hypothetical protein
MLGMATSPAETMQLEALAVRLASANAGKQSGFYTDFDSDSGSWTSPADVSQVSFDQIRPLIGDYIAETQRQLDEFMSFRNTAPSASATG